MVGRQLIAPVSIRLPDEDAERVRRNHEDRILQLQSLPINQSTRILDVQLEDGVPTPIPHGLGRKVSVFASPPRGAIANGRITEVRSASFDPKKYVVLQADDFGATVTADVWCF